MESRKASATRSTIPLPTIPGPARAGTSAIQAPRPPRPPGNRRIDSFIAYSARPPGRRRGRNHCGARRLGARTRATEGPVEGPERRAKIRTEEAWCVLRGEPRATGRTEPSGVERRRDAMAAARVSLNLISAPTTKQYENYVTGAVRRAATAGGRGTTIYVTISSAASGAGGAVPCRPGARWCRRTGGTHLTHTHTTHPML